VSDLWQFQLMFITIKNGKNVLVNRLCLWSPKAVYKYVKLSYHHESICYKERHKGSK